MINPSEKSVMECPNRARWHAYLTGVLAEAEATALENHAAACATCLIEMRAAAFADEQNSIERPACAFDAQHEAPLGALLDQLKSLWSATDDRDTPVSGIDLRDVLDPAVQAGELGRIGDFRVLEILGRGGMGIVLKAEQQALHRLVALKMIRPDVLDKDELRGRFLTEARAVAALHHPHIVQIYEVGQHRGGPYFAMELVEGDSLEKHLSGRSQVPAGAARLVEQLARAIDYAHAQGIVHRDLKPANVLLTRQGLPKITDFGLAKHVAEDQSATRTGAVIGTPAYMAPEQALGNALAVGPRTDVYALGAILYEMLTGRPPFRGSSVLDTLDQVRAHDPIPPSRWEARLPRDLEIICLKALAKQPAERYASAHALAEDLRRFQEGHAILARPVGVVEQLWKWARRRPASAALVMLAAFLFIGFAAATVVLTAANQRERQAHADAEHARLVAERREQEANKERLEARRQAKTAMEAARFLTDLFQTADPTGAESFGFRSGQQKGADLTARQLLDVGAQRVQHIEDPAVRATMLDTLGNVYRSLGMYEQADPLLSEALKVRSATGGAEHQDTATTLHHLAWLRQDQGKFAEAERLYREALTLRQKLFGTDDLRVGATMFNLAWTLAHQYDRPTPARLKEAETLFSDVVRLRRQRLSPKHRDVGLALTALAVVRLARGETMQSGLPLLQEGYAILEQADNRDAASSCITTYFFAVLLRKAGLYAEAELLYRKVLQRSCAFMGEEHPLNILLLGDLAGLLRQKGDRPAAEETIRKALEFSRRSPLRWHPAGIEARLELADLVRERGDAKEAEKLYREALEVARRIDHRAHLPTVLARLAGLLRQQDRNAEAEQLLGSALKNAPNDPATRPQ